MTATAAASSDELPPYVTITVSGLTSYAGGTLTCFRLMADGSTAPVRQADPNLTIEDASHVLFDYEMPLGEVVSYRTLAVDGVHSDLEQTTSTVTVETSDSWLVHPGTPALSQSITLLSLAERRRDVNSATMYPIGRANAVVLTDGTLKAPTGTMIVGTSTLDARDDLLTLLQGLSPLLLNVPATLDMGVTSEWIAVTDVVERAYIGAAAERAFTLTYAVVDRPVGTVSLTRSWADVLTEAATWTELGNLYATWLGVYTGQAGV